MVLRSGITLQVSDWNSVGLHQRAAVPTQSAVRRRNSVRVMPNPGAGFKTGALKTPLSHTGTCSSPCTWSERDCSGTILWTNLLQNGAPQALIPSSYPWKCSRQGWIGPWATWSSGWYPAHGRGAETRSSLRSPSTQTVLWIYDSVIDCRFSVWISTQSPPAETP